jgi:hypothetical protein
MMNPMAFMSPQQQEMLRKIQAVSQNISAQIKTSDNQLQLWLETDDPEAAKLMPQIQELLVNSIASSLYQMFNISGERV